MSESAKPHPALAEWDDPQVQIVYRLLCDDELWPPEGEHWEGFLARAIVAALRQPYSREPEAL